MKSRLSKTALTAVLVLITAQGLDQIRQPKVSGSTAMDISQFPRALRGGEVYGKLPLIFEANEGQTDPQVRFLARSAGYTVFLTPRELVLSLRSSRPAALPPEDSAPNDVGSVLRMKLAGASARPQIIGIGETATKVNYFRGKDRAAWRTGVPTYGQVQY